MRSVLVVLVVLTPAVAFAGVGTLLAADAGGAIGAFTGAFVGNVVSRWTLLRRHEIRCVHYEKKEKKE